MSESLSICSSLISRAAGAVSAESWQALPYEEHLQLMAELDRDAGDATEAAMEEFASLLEPGDTITLMFCPMRDGRNGGHMGWALLGDGRFVNPSDGGCNGNDDNIEKWKAWLDQGFASNKEAMAAE